MMESRGTPLLLAASRGKVGVVRKYLKDGVDPNYRDEQGFTALHKAAVRGDLAVLETLLERKKIDVNARNRDRETALILGARNGNYFVVRNLLARKPDVRHVDKHGCSALDYAKHHRHKGIARILREAGASSTGKREKSCDRVVRQVVHEDTPKSLLCQVLLHPKTTIELRQLQNVMRESKITSLPMFQYAHYLLQFLRRVENPAMKWFIDLDGSVDFLYENVYLKAARLRLNKGGQFLVKIAARYAQTRGLIRGGGAANVGAFLEVVADSQKQRILLQHVVDEILREFPAMDNRIIKAENMSSEALKEVNRLANYQEDVVRDIMRLNYRLDELRWSMRLKEKVDNVAGVFRFLLSTIPVFGSALGNLAYSSVEVFFGLTTEDLVGIGTDLAKETVSRGLSADLTDPSSIGIVTSERFLSKLTPRSRQILEFSVRRSKFEGLRRLSAELKCHSY